MNIVIPMAGFGKRFEEAGYKQIKPLIPVGKDPMFKVAVDALDVSGNLIFIIREHKILRDAIKYYYPEATTIVLDEPTQGAACTVLKAAELINNNRPLLIANCDQYIEPGCRNMIASVKSYRADGGILYFFSTSPIWSYVATRGDLATNVAEKSIISERATVGVYYFARGADFVKAANQMIDADDRTNGEFYVCPVFNWLIASKKRIITHPTETMYGLGTPEQLNEYLDTYGR